MQIYLVTKNLQRLFSIGRFVLESAVLVALVHEFVSLFHKFHEGNKTKESNRDLRNLASIIYRHPVYRCYCLVNAL